MAQSNKLKFQRGAAANTEFQDRTKAQRIVTMTMTVRPASENLQLYSALWNFEQGQAIVTTDVFSLEFDRCRWISPIGQILTAPEPDMRASRYATAGRT